MRNPKIMSLRDLAGVCADRRLEGQRVVMCHGVFDLLHPGHLHHLAAARDLGDVLVVTVTADQHVNKGPGRPVYTHAERAAMLAALEAVDFVAVNESPTAALAIESLRPHVYVKGSDYASRDDDLTGAIIDEEDAVIATGGRIHFTDEPTMSSSSLINSHLRDGDSPAATWMASFRSRFSEGDVCSWMAKLAGLRVLVVGEAIIDEYEMCEALGKSSKDPVLAFRQMACERQVGGSLAIANHCAGLGASVISLFRAGKAPEDRDLIASHLHPRVTPIPVVSDIEPTIVKRRYVDQHTEARVFETYVMHDGPTDPDDERRTRDRLAEVLGEVDLVVVADYGHGLMSDAMVHDLAESGVLLAVNTQSNAGNRGYNTISRYPRSDFVCLNGGEVGLELRRRHLTLRELAPQLFARLGTRRLIVTEGARGSLCCEGEDAMVEVPAFAPQVRDRVGAGDALFAVTSLLSGVGAPMDLTGFFGNLAGAAAVAQLGNRSHVSGVDLTRHAVALMK